jgi:hypothetical protein
MGKAHGISISRFTALVDWKPSITFFCDFDGHRSWCAASAQLVQNAGKSRFIYRDVITHSGHSSLPGYIPEFRRAIPHSPGLTTIWAQRLHKMPEKDQASASEQCGPAWTLGFSHPGKDLIAKVFPEFWRYRMKRAKTS